jgi:hypothetical protein
MVLFASAAGAAERAPLMTRSILLVAAIDAATDNIGAGWCGRGAEDIESILQERKALAMKYFNRNELQVATLSPAIGR